MNRSRRPSVCLELSSVTSWVAARGDRLRITHKINLQMLNRVPISRSRKASPMRALTLVALLALIPQAAVGQSANAVLSTDDKKGALVRLPASNFDIFKTLQDAQFPGTLDDQPQKPKETAATPKPVAWNVGPRSVGILNSASVSMHFNAGGVEFELAPKAAKTIDLPAEMTALILVYSIQSQRKQMTLPPGRGYTLDIDVQKREI